MKKNYALFFIAAMAFGLNAKAQQFVSTTPANRNVVLEEFTGRTCQYCPQGHVVANQIMEENPNRVWAVNIHAGSFSPQNYPNLNTSDGTAINGGFTIAAYPSGAVNRQGNGAVGRNQWSELSTSQFTQLSEVNVGGQVVYDPITRIASITVELYYTSDSPEATNYLTVYMLQDSIWGSQTGGSSNPQQYVNGEYCHMHILRDVVNSNDCWGDVITTTAAGTLITKNYSYVIPEVIGNPNGVEVDLDNIHFLAFVSKSHYYILSANMLEKVESSDDPIHPVLNSVAQENVVSCTHEKNFTLSMLNGGGMALTSLKINAIVEGNTTQHNWQGNALALENFTVDMSVDIPFGAHDVEFCIVEANGEPVDESKTIEATCEEWQEVEIEGMEEELTIEIMQDAFGNQTTWKMFASDMSVLASGGPYSILPGTFGTSLNVEDVTVPANECLMFVIYDNIGNGICCDFGEGYYRITDSRGNVLVDGNGEFGSQAAHVFSFAGDEIPTPITGCIDPVLDDDKATLFASYAEGLNPFAAGFCYRSENETEYITINADAVEHHFQATVLDLQPATNYLYKSFIKMTENGSAFYGEEKPFSTLVTNVSEKPTVVSAYPNPVSDILHLETDGEVSKVEIFDVFGRRVMSLNPEGKNVEIDVKPFGNGLYLARTIGRNNCESIFTFSISH